MNEPQHFDLDLFVDRMRSGEIDAEQVAEFERKLTEDSELRRRYRVRMRMEANLLAVFQSVPPEVVPPLMSERRPRKKRKWWYLAAGTGAAAALLLAFLTGLVHFGNNTETPPPIVAHVESESEAAWAASSSVAVGAALTASELQLKSGVAELRFRSGAKVSLEAPARVELIDPMRCRLHQGTAIVEVPDSATGFVVQTPRGHAVDHGTRFAVSVDETTDSANFEVLAGEISVHDEQTGTVVPLLEGEATRLTKAGIETLNPPPSRRIVALRNSNLRRLQTDGRETSIVRYPKAGHGRTLLHPDLLMVKRDITRTTWTEDGPPNHGRDRRSLIGFDLKDIEVSQIRNVRLQLNLVRTGLGYASLLPEVCSFEVYGVRDDNALESWPTEGLRWKDAPGSKGTSRDIDATEVRRLAGFDIPRGRVRGSIVVETRELADFIREDRTGKVSFLLVRTTPPLNTWSLVHAFAASTHPEAAGPSLVLEMGGSEAD